MVKDVKAYQTESSTRKFSVQWFASGIGRGFWGFTLVPDGDKESPPVVEVGVVFLVSTTELLGDGVKGVGLILF